MLARSAKDELRRMLRMELRMLLAEAAGKPRASALRRSKSRAEWPRLAHQRT